MMSDEQARGPFTGRHITIILVAFFAVVITVNIVMARFALSTFGGTVVDNSYVASQQYNKWLAEGRKEAALGWTEQTSRDGQGHVEVAINGKDGQPLSRADVRAVAEHPLGRLDDIPLRFSEMTNGRYISNGIVPQGRWQVSLEIRRDGQMRRTIAELR